MGDGDAANSELKTRDYDVQSPPRLVVRRGCGLLLETECSVVCLSVGRSVTAKRLNISRCRLGCGFGWVQESINRSGARWSELN